MTSFTFTDKYTEDFQRYVDELYENPIADRQKRIETVDQLINDYVQATGKRPAGAQLDRLATLILREELTDMHPDKMSRAEYPLLSPSQQGRRHSGERSFKLAEEVATDGRDYRLPTRLNRRILK
ncbi:hypothetical protein [Bacillus chungangensis]|uniref:Uncharacterized protein n=1 Tax=Bacillus chungangensis TaxID=587633 RepID=A0ABT9WM82_9BACI|nr:hypothetical protein [Bacillus chungangensis]MDQ0174399.1 hypothetical protein [Bacillus chungangensis]